MYSLTIFGKIFFSLTVTEDVIWYLDNGALTKKWSNGFSKSIAQLTLLPIKFLITLVLEASF